MLQEKQKRGGCAMRIKSKPVLLIVALLLLFLAVAPTSHALPLTARGPLNLPIPPGDGFPVWYQDSNGLSLGQCLDSVLFCGLLADATFNPALPVSFPTNYPGEQFYFLGTVLMGPPYNLLYVAATEGSFAGALGDPVAGQQAVFSRVRIRANITLPGTYTVTHPYGTETFTVTTPGRRAINFSNGVFGLVALSFDGPLDLSPVSAPLVGPYLRPSAAPGGAPTDFVTDIATGNKYIAIPGALTPVTGSPTGNNFVEISGPDGIVRETLFDLVGKVVGNDVTPKSITFPVRAANGVLSTAQTVTVTNISRTTPLSVTVTIDPASANPADFVITADGCTGVPVAASTATVPGTCTFGVQFGSTAPTPVDRTASVLITTTAPAGLPPMHVALSGTIDSIPPQVLLKVPGDGQRIPANSSILAVFSEPVVISATTFTLTSSGNPITASNVAFDPGSNTATFVPANQLLPIGAANAATISAGVTDLVGNPLASAVTWSFSTVAADNTAPTVATTSPARNAIGVRLDSAIKITFDDKTNDPVVAGEMSVLSINNTTFALSSGVTGSVTFDPATKTATFTPSAPLAPGTAYTVTVKGGAAGVADWAQNALAADLQFSFITNNPPSHPALIFPPDGATGIPSTVTLRWAKSTDDDGDQLDYHIELCQNRFFVGTDCTHQNVPAVASAPKLNGAYFAGLGGLGMAVIGLVSFGGIKGRKRFLALMIVVLLMSGAVISACKTKTETETVTAPSAAEVTF